jgi:type IV pilus assembly protein PilM
MSLGSFFSGLFQKKQKSCLGIDLGASGIKIAELSRGEQGVILSNYVLAQTREGSKINLSKVSVDEAALIIRHMIERAGIKTKRAVISLPVGETFSTVIDLPAMNPKELAQTIPFEARKYVPVPIEEVVLDWSVTGETIQPQSAVGQANQPAEKPVEKENKENATPAPVANLKEMTPGKKTIHILIVAVPQEVINRIAQIAKMAGLEVLALEQEAFGMARSLAGKNNEISMLVDMGTESIDAIVLENGMIRLTHTFREVNPEDMVYDIPKVLGIFEAKSAKKIKRIIFTGGRTAKPQWLKDFSAKLGREIILGNPFSGLKYDQRLEIPLKEIAPYMAVAVGGAMREI